jgi:hypothetical protein
MFRLAKDRIVLWPVTLVVPADGGPQLVPVQVAYRLLTSADEHVWRDALEAAITSDQREADRLVATLLEQRVTGWSDIVDDADGQPIPYSSEALASLLDLPYVRDGLLLGLFSASHGAAPKN